MGDVRGVANCVLVEGAGRVHWGAIGVRGVKEVDSPDNSGEVFGEW